MNKKTKTYILLVAVLGIWGTIGYKIINGLNPKQPLRPTQNIDVSFNPEKHIKQDTFSITEVDRDPFLGTLSRVKAKTTAKSSLNQTQKKTNYQPVITYSGLVKKQNASDQVFVVNINNNQYLLKKGQIADSVKLLKGNSKTITVSYKKKSLTINRQ